MPLKTLKTKQTSRVFTGENTVTLPLKSYTEQYYQF